MKLALYTTIYPGVKPFLPDWWKSVRRQSDSAFELWIGLDSVNVDEACAAMGARPDAHWVHGQPDDTPAQVRQRAWDLLIPAVDAVVLVDADDIMRPHRIEQARLHIERYDVTACALQLVAESGRDLGYTMPPKSFRNATAVLPAHNIFGLTNTSYRTSLLERCLPVPEEAPFIDWYLSTQAWLRRSSFHFANSVGVDYRQHCCNVMRHLPPFTPQGVRKATRAVRNHFQVLTASLPAEAFNQQIQELHQATQRVEQFAKCALCDEEWLRKYTDHLNRCEALPLWWSCVARPELDTLWKPTKLTHANH
jgi:hypothetical protein